MFLTCVTRPHKQEIDCFIRAMKSSVQRVVRSTDIGYVIATRSIKVFYLRQNTERLEREKKAHPFFSLQLQMK